MAKMLHTARIGGKLTSFIVEVKRYGFKSVVVIEPARGEPWPYGPAVYEVRVSRKSLQPISPR